MHRLPQRALLTEPMLTGTRRSRRMPYGPGTNERGCPHPVVSLKDVENDAGWPAYLAEIMRLIGLYQRDPQRLDLDDAATQFFNGFGPHHVIQGLPPLADGNDGDDA